MYFYFISYAVLKTDRNCKKYSHTTLSNPDGGRYTYNPIKEIARECSVVASIIITFAWWNKDVRAIYIL